MTAIKSQLKQTISDVSAKSAEVSAGQFADTMSAQKATNAQSAIDMKERLVDAKQTSLDTVMEKLEKPPMKDVSESKGCGNSETKQVVDQEAVKALETEKKASITQLTQAKSQVADARTEAATATADALTQAGISKDKQSEMSALMDKINNIQDSLAESKPVDEKDIAKLTTDFKTISDGLTKDQNKAGLVSKAFFDPVKRGLSDILKSLEKPPAAEATATTTATASTTPAATSTTTPAADTTVAATPTAATP